MPKYKSSQKARTKTRSKASEGKKKVGQKLNSPRYSGKDEKSYQSSFPCSVAERLRTKHYEALRRKVLPTLWKLEVLVRKENFSSDAREKPDMGEGSWRKKLTENNSVK